VSEERAPDALDAEAEQEQDQKRGVAAEEAQPSVGQDLPALARVIEALLFLSSDPVSRVDLAEAAAVEQEQIVQALALLGEQLAPGARGLQLREIGGGYLLASSPEAEEAARRLFSRPRVATLTPAQTETLAIVAYLQPISRPEIGRIRGVSADSATATLLERGLVEESGRSQFGAALYRTTIMFLKLFGLRSIKDLPDIAQWDSSPEEQSDLRDRLLRAGEARAGGGPSGD
jgi:segregation and condensation protein B